MGSAALPIIGGALGLYSAGTAASGQRRAARAQEGIARNQRQLLTQASPYYNEVLRYLSQSAGLTPTGQATPATAAGAPSAGSSAPLPTGSGALPDSALGIFAQNPADRYQFQAAEEQLARLRDTRANQLQHALGLRGAGQATTAAALARNEGDYQSGTAQFRRQLAMAARAEQERRVGALLQALAPGLGAGAGAAGIFGSQASLYGNQASAAGAGVGNLLSNWLLAQAMRQGTAGPVNQPSEEDALQFLMGRASGLFG
jgi:hypothetical protein